MKNIYIDLANLNAECRFKKYDLDFRKMFIFLNDKYSPDNIFLFTGYLDKYKSLYKENQGIGFIYIFKEAVFNHDESKVKANCDVDIAINGVLDTLEKNLNESIIISSDGDFASLIKFWMDRKVKVKIISPADPNRCSYLLRKLNISITFLPQIIQHLQKEKALTEDETSARPFS